jgi:hypothetical protein
MEKSEVIIDVGSEGDALTLYGLRTFQGWVFSRQVIDQPPETLIDSWNRRTRQSVTTWPAALSLLDEYPWQHLYPLSVHPDFRAMVYDAVTARFKSDVEKNPRRLADWTNKCMAPETRASRSS